VATQWALGSGLVTFTLSVDLSAECRSQGHTPLYPYTLTPEHPFSLHSSI
jgi:hypothetical protein